MFLSLRKFIQYKYHHTTITCCQIRYCDLTSPLGKTSTNVEGTLYFGPKWKFSSSFVADVKKTLHLRHVRVERKKFVLRTMGRNRTHGIRSYEWKIGRLLNFIFECDVLWTTLAESNVEHTSRWNRPLWEEYTTPGTENKRKGFILEQMTTSCREFKLMKMELVSHRWIEV